MKKVKLTKLSKTTTITPNTEHISLDSSGLTLAKAPTLKGVFTLAARGVQELPVGYNCVLYVRASSNYSAVFLVTWRKATMIVQDTDPSHWSIFETEAEVTSYNGLVKQSGSANTPKIKNNMGIPITYRYIAFPLD